MDNNTIRWLWRIPGRKKWYIAVLIVAQALHGASGVLYALFLKQVVDAAAAGERIGFWSGVLSITGVILVQLGLRAVIRWMNERSKATLENIFKERLFGMLLKKDFLSVSAVHSGQWMNRLTNDAKVVADSYVEILPGLSGMIVKLISALIMLLVLEPRFALILIPGGAVVILFTWLFRKALKRLHKSIQEADGKLRVLLQERISNMLLIRSFAEEEQTLNQVSAQMEIHKAARMRRVRFSNLCNIGFGAAMNAMYLLGIVWCGYGILTRTISFGTLTAVTQLVTQIQTPFANITSYIPRYYAMLASAERLMEVETFAEDPTDALSLSQALDLYNELSSLGLKEAGFTYYPSADDISVFSKDNMPQALTGLSLEIRKGAYVAFTGKSGSGKSTALKLLMCVYPLDQGDRYYRKGTQEFSLGPSQRRLFAYVPQGNALMKGTIREIVSFARPEAADKDEELWKALNIACAQDFVRELDQGLDTVLGERGSGLSEGQMQRLSIARAIFSQRPVLLLDESTSALDTETEKKLLENLKQLTDKTVLIVTHREAALAICDRVLRFTESGVDEA